MAEPITDVDVGGGATAPVFIYSADAPAASASVVTAAPSAALIVETGDGLSTANSYATAAEASTYFDATTNPAAWLSATTSQKEQALRVATQWLDAKYGSAWIGTRSSSTQALDWPRSYAYDRAGNAIGDVVPVRLKQACAEVALRYIQDATLLAPDLAAGTGVRAESLQVGPIAISTTFNGEPTPETTFTTVARLLSSAGLTAAGGFAQR